MWPVMTYLDEQKFTNKIYVSCFVHLGHFGLEFLCSIKLCEN